MTHTDNNFIQLKELVLSVSDEKNGFCHVNLNRPNSEPGMNEPHEQNFLSFDFGFTYSAVASFLDYLYTGQVNLTSETIAKEIYKGKFQVFIEIYLTHESLGSVASVYRGHHNRRKHSFCVEAH